MGILRQDGSRTQPAQGLVWIHGSGETPRCGSGRRLVVATIGRKWVRLRPANGAGFPDRVTRETYDRVLIGGAA